MLDKFTRCFRLEINAFKRRSETEFKKIIIYIILYFIRKSLILIFRFLYHFGTTNRF